MQLRDLSEFGLIAWLARKLARGGGAQPAAGSVALAIGDDASLLRLPPGMELVATIDALIEEVHFRRDWTSPEDLGWKALAVNVSDLGAMGARPLAALITLALPAETPLTWIDRVYEGVSRCAAEYGCPVTGGDTVRSPRHVALTVTALGTVPEGRAVLRSGAQVGDLVCVTGVLGDSGAALALLERGADRKDRTFRPLRDWHFRPRPPVAAGAALREAGLATAMLDLSDGLASDLRHLAARSGVGIKIESDRLPISDAARQAALRLGTDPLDWALFGGEDYQLLFTVPPNRFDQVPLILAPLGVAATLIGRVTRRGISLIGEDGKSRPLRLGGFAHFARAELNAEDAKGAEDAKEGNSKK